MTDQRPRAFRAVGIGTSQLLINDWSNRTGGDTRTGLEDNVRLDRNRLAASNAALDKRAVDLCKQYECPAAGWLEVRAILGMRPVAA